MVGTFYRSPSPKDPPFVEVGSIVRVGDPLCIIEVMKLFTTVEADRAGRIVSIFPGNAEMVEFGQPLFQIESV
ncbi:Biotin carboxyl carrier protein of acetyl-CoA carboxylase [Mycobacterium tuberculosis]|nr:Biotin carboxyl carrier protein of acetyl-CoA carboxylase [Mycobacterium tuberculosis]